MAAYSPLHDTDVFQDAAGMPAPTAGYVVPEVAMGRNYMRGQFTHQAPQPMTCKSGNADGVTLDDFAEGERIVAKPVIDSQGRATGEAHCYKQDPLMRFAYEHGHDYEREPVSGADRYVLRPRTGNAIAVHKEQQAIAHYNALLNNARLYIRSIQPPVTTVAFNHAYNTRYRRQFLEFARHVVEGIRGTASNTGEQQEMAQLIMAMIVKRNQITSLNGTPTTFVAIAGMTADAVLNHMAVHIHDRPQDKNTLMEVHFSIVLFNVLLDTFFVQLDHQAATARVQALAATV